MNVTTHKGIYHINNQYFTSVSYTHLAWVGDGYSFGLNGVADVAQIMPYYGGNARPFIISLDGWAGTQRYLSLIHI